MAATLWRDYDQTALDAQFNLRARTPEHLEFFARWAAEGEALRATRPDARIDLAYGARPAQKLDFFPTHSGAPLLIFIHGGYWQSLDKGDFLYLAPAFNAAGVAYASLNYTLAPEASIPEMVAEVRRAVAWLAAQGAALGFDAGRMVIAGHSAGGHLAAMVLSTDWEKDFGLPADTIKGGCSISGIYDIEPLRHSYQQPVLQLTAEVASSHSPIRCLPAAAGPLICAVGSTEPEEFQDQQREYLAAWRAAGLIGFEVALPGRHHFDAVDALGESDQALHRQVLKLVRGG